MKDNPIRICIGSGFAAAVVALFPASQLPHSQASNRSAATDTQAAPQPDEAARGSGTLEGTAKIACPYSSPNCRDLPYHVGLFIQADGRESTPIYIYASPDFSIILPAGKYMISSADTRGSCCLPVLRPISVLIRPGSLTQIEVRFEPGPQLPSPQLPPR